MHIFWQQVGIIEENDGFCIGLDDKKVKTPALAVLKLPNRQLAEAIAEEWLAQKDTVNTATMPLMQLSATAMDNIGCHRSQVIEQLASHATTDLLCYRAEYPANLFERQNALWQPLLEWAQDHYGITLNVTRGIMPIQQPETALSILRQALENENNFMLSAIGCAAGGTGSLLLALALRNGQISSEEALTTAELDSLFQSEQWGEDPETTRRRDSIRFDLRAAERMMKLLE